MHLGPPARVLPGILLVCAALAGFPVLAGPDPGAATAAPEAARPVLLRIKLLHPKAMLPRLAARGFDIAGVDLEAKTADVVGTTEDAARLRALGLAVTIVRYLDLPVPEVDSLYTSPGEMATLLASYEAAYPTLAKLE